MYQGKNIISTNESFVRNDLFNTIHGGRFFDSNKNKVKYSPLAKNLRSPEAKLGIYLANIRTFNKQDNIIYIKYIYYPYIFKKSLIRYLFIRNTGVNS